MVQKFWTIYKIYEIHIKLKLQFEINLYELTINMSTLNINLASKCMS